MVDIKNAEARSRNMAAIKGKDTQPELRLRKALHARGFRYRLHPAGLPGRPDLLLPKYRAAVFVHGCFWHRHPGCRYATTPGTRLEFWRSKFQQNTARDARAVVELGELGWRVAVIWECALRGDGAAKATNELCEWLLGSGPRFETEATTRCG